MTDKISSERPRTRRRSLRIVLRLPLIISAVDGPMPGEWEPAETVTVSQHGAMVRTKRDFHVGSTIEVRMRDKDRWARARIVWKSARVVPGGFELGFEILDQEGFWEIRFPADRWTDKMPPSPADR